MDRNVRVPDDGDHAVSEEPVPLSSSQVDAIKHVGGWMAKHVMVLDVVVKGVVCANLDEVTKVGQFN